MNLTIFRFAIIKGLRNRATLIFNCLLPIVLIFVRPMWVADGGLFGGGNLASFGLLLMTMWGGAFLMSQGILNDRTSGSIVRILSAPVTTFNYLTQNLLAYMVPLTLQIAIVSILGMIFYGWSTEFAIALFVCYTVFTMSAIALSFAWNCLFKSKETSFSSFSALITFGSFLSGGLIPIEFFPLPLQYAGAVFPAYWAIRGIRTFSDYGFAFDYFTSLAAMLLIAAICLLYGGKRRII